MDNEDMLLFAELLGREFAESYDSARPGRALYMRRAFYRVLEPLECGGLRHAMRETYTSQGGVL
jgi:hypothetical protein